ncbi:MAG: FKBP-type peptidyl-prolyl cis-trans isomerase [Bacteroidales bacterium]
MKSLKLLTVLTITTSVFFSCTNNEKGNLQPDSKLTTLTDSASYAIGMAIASDFAQSDIDSLNMSAFFSGFNAFDMPEDAQISQTEIGPTINRYMQAEARRKYPALEPGEKFLAANAQKEGITTTESGLQYEIIEEGSGKSPEMHDTVTVHYHGTTIDDSVFDSSKGKEPATFVIGQVIEGWNEALQLIKEGGKMKIYVPYKLGYGAESKGKIRPFETLIFDIELLNVKEGEAPEMDQQQMMQQMMQQQQQQGRR